MDVGLACFVTHMLPVSLACYCTLGPSYSVLYLPWVYRSLSIVSKEKRPTEAPTSQALIVKSLLAISSHWCTIHLRTSPHPSPSSKLLIRSTRALGTPLPCPQLPYQHHTPRLPTYVVSQPPSSPLSQSIHILILTLIPSTQHLLVLVLVPQPSNTQPKAPQSTHRPRSTTNHQHQHVPHLTSPHPISPIPPPAQPPPHAPPPPAPMHA